MLAYLESVVQTLSQLGPSWQAYFELHEKWMVSAVFAAFTLVNSLRILAYIPQILKAARDENGATAVSCLTWGLFLLSHLTTVAYSVVCLGDLVMAVIFFGNALACFGATQFAGLYDQRHAALFALVFADIDGLPRIGQAAHGEHAVDVAQVLFVGGLVFEVLPHDSPAPRIAG